MKPLAWAMNGAAGCLGKGTCAGCNIEAQCKGGVRADSMSLLIVAAGERCGWLRV